MAPASSPRSKIPMKALDNLFTRGLVRYVGASNMSAWQIMKAQGLARQYSYARFETAQCCYTIAGRDLEREIVPMVSDQQIGLMIWSPLASGFLAGKFTREGAATSNDARRLSFDFPPVDKEHAYDVIEAIQPIAASRLRASRSPLHQKPVTSVIVGAKSIEQLDDNLAATEIELSADELATLDKISARPFAAVSIG